MKYVKLSLLPTEKLIYASRPHWIVFSSSLLLFLLALAIWLYLPSYVGHSEPLWLELRFSQWFASAVAIAGVFAGLRALILYSTSEYGVTDQRVIMKRGWIHRHSVEIFLQRLEAVNVNQTVLGRIFNYGSVFVIGTGGTKDAYYDVPAPIKFRRIVQQQLVCLSEKQQR